ncbi:hypothetical protein [Actinoplanes awajinensis]|uniref:Uncharacterized protein n=1 Tax=Actinoplanes awajinensis subsp. mycoplanecinus TaxID=135947 RepID=A0A101JGU7_9ACTN|nr:hypothetical protein [Actinoplanes awajinensis]KUL26520.1 hypothetical protein ADL15_38185 [Actinoplanes awajinensis subsp. mycoplanecinus]
MTGAEFHGIDIDLLADYIGGALDGTPEADRVAALIAVEPAWQEAFSLLAPEMATVGALLGDLPGEPMPDDVVARLDSAFAALAPSGTALGIAPDDGGEHVGTAPDVPKTVLDLEKHRRRRGNRRWLRFAAPIGIAAGAIGFFGYALTAPQSAHDDSGSADSAAAPAAGGVMVAGTPETTLDSGTDYTLGTLTQSLKRTADAPLSASADVPQVSPDIAGVQELDVLARLRLPAALLDCLSAIAQENSGGTLTAQSVDYARFDGAPALVVQFSADNGEWVWASGADCGLPGVGADTLGQVPVR